jgi:hypothetical protein
VKADRAMYAAKRSANVAPPVPALESEP